MGDNIMPYIAKEGRPPLNILIQNLTELIESKGDLNYVICELVGQLILKTKISYTQISEWIDAVDGAENELRRRLLEVYENLRIAENGDVPSFAQIFEDMK